METTLMLKTAQARRRQGGFTLIELIAVIIILGILAAVIIPRYADMTTQAKTSAANGAVSEGIARFNMAYANYVMRNNGNVPANLAALTASTMNATMDLGDYVVNFQGTGGAGTTITCNAYSNPPTTGGARVSDGTAVPVGTILGTKSINWPQ